jgi:effector-binding domain-containing protein
MAAINRISRVVVMTGFWLTILSAPALLADDKGPLIGEVRVRTMAPVTYAYVATETTFDKLGESIGAAMGDIQKAAADGKIKVAGSFVIVYPESSSHLKPDKPFKVQIGFLIEEGGTAAGEVKVRKTEPFKAATLLYTGSPADMGQCYPKLFGAIREMGLEPSGEEREFTTYWEGMESQNNVVLVQVGVKEKAGAGPGKAQVKDQAAKGVSARR